MFSSPILTNTLVSGFLTLKEPSSSRAVSGEMLQRQSSTSTRLLVYPQAYGCPSFDLECLQTLAYMKFLGTKYVLEFCSEPLISPTGALPALLNEFGFCVGGLSKVAQEFENKAGKQLNSRLDPKQKAEAEAYEAIVARDLKLALVRLELFCACLYQSNPCDFNS